MCKHVAAAQYGVGARLDENPLLFFELRGIDVGRFIDVALENRVEALLANMDRKAAGCWMTATLGHYSECCRYKKVV